MGDEPIDDGPADEEPDEPAATEAGHVEPPTADPHASDSSAQSDAESFVLAAASEEFGVAIAPRDVTTRHGLTVRIDGVAEDLSVLAEVYVRQTRLLPGNERKVLTDALRLVWFRDFYAPHARLVLCLTSYEAARRLKWPDDGRPTSWMAEALRDLGVDVEVFDLPDGGGSVRDAQTRLLGEDGGLDHDEARRRGESHRGAHRDELTVEAIREGIDQQELVPTAACPPPRRTPECHQVVVSTA